MVIIYIALAYGIAWAFWIPVMPKAHALTMGRTPNTYCGGSDPFGMFTPAVAAIIMRLFIHDRSPWVLGVIVRRDGRGAGIGSLLLARLERWAYRQGYELLWVATGGAAVGFYQRCGWRIYETVDRDFEPAIVLTNEPRAEPM